MTRIDREILSQYPLGKADLARLYSPNVCRKSALRLMNKYIHNAKGLLPALEAMGYSRAAHHFTSSWKWCSYIITLRMSARVGRDEEKCRPRRDAV